MRLTSYKTAWILVIVSGVWLSSCKVGENYTRPDERLPEGYRVEADSLGDTLNIANISWREFFEDSVLNELIEKALKNNLEIAIADQDIQSFYENLLQRRANFFPTLTAAPEYYRENHSDNWYSNPNAKYYERNGGTPPPRWYVNRVQHLIPLESSWEIDLWGKLRRERESAQARLESTRAAYRALQTTIVAEVATSYYNLLRLDAQLEVANSNLALNDSTLTIVRLQYRAGQVTSLAILQTENQKLQAESLIPRIEREMVQEENYLRFLLGEFPDKILRINSLDAANIKTKEAAGYPVDLLKNRPDVQLAEYNLMAANADVGAAIGARYPSLVLSAGVGLDAFVLNSLFSPLSLFGTFSSGLVQPIFQNRRLKTAQKVAEIERNIAMHQFRLTLINAVGEVSNELTNIKKLKEEHELAVQLIEASTIGVSNASLLFKSGMANYLEVINAQANALDNELNLVNVKMQILNSNVELYRKLGGGWN